MQNKDIKFGYIYKTTIIDNNSKLNNHYYIGKKESSVFDKNYFGSGLIITEYINKYGKNNLICEILEWADTREELNKLEYKWVDKERLKDPLCLNKCLGGSGGNTIILYSDDEKMHFIDKMKDIGKELWKNEEYILHVKLGRYIALKEKYESSPIFLNCKNELLYPSDFSSNTVKFRWYNNGTYQAMLPITHKLNGWVHGKLFSKHEKYNYYHNGIFQLVGYKKPDGFIEGKLKDYRTKVKSFLKKSEKMESLLKEYDYKKYSKINSTKEERSKKISENKIEYYKNEEHRKAQSIKKLNSINNSDEREKISKSLKERWSKLSEEEKAEYSKKVKLRFTDDVRQKISESLKSRRYYNNGSLQIYAKEPPDETWVEGKLYNKIPVDWKYFHKGNLTVRAPECPEGFIPGKYKDSVEYRRAKNKNAYNICIW